MNRTGTVDRYLADVPFFGGCSAKELAKIASLATTLNLPAGKELTTEGRMGREFSVIIDGHATVGLHGAEVTTLGPGDFFGEIALLDGGPRTATVTAMTDVTVAVIGHHEFVTMIEDVPFMARKLLVGVAARLRQADSRLGV